MDLFEKYQQRVKELKLKKETSLPVIDGPKLVDCLVKLTPEEIEAFNDRYLVHRRDGLGREVAACMALCEIGKNYDLPEIH